MQLYRRNSFESFKKIKYTENTIMALVKIQYM